MVRTYCVLAVFLLFSNGCANRSVTLYEQLGGKQKINEIVTNFVHEIEFNSTILPYFMDSNITRFREKFAQQLCVLADGPCEYTGDDMTQVHTGMNISEADFNLTVDLFIQSMDKANVPHPLQNQLINRMTHTRELMLYR